MNRIYLGGGFFNNAQTYFLVIFTLLVYFTTIKYPTAEYRMQDIKKYLSQDFAYFSCSTHFCSLY